MRDAAEVALDGADDVSVLCAGAPAAFNNSDEAYQQGGQGAAAAQQLQPLAAADAHTASPSPPDPRACCWNFTAVTLCLPSTPAATSATLAPTLSLRLVERLRITVNSDIIAGALMSCTFSCSQCFHTLLRTQTWEAPCRLKQERNMKAVLVHRRASKLATSKNQCSDKQCSDKDGWLRHSKKRNLKTSPPRGVTAARALANAHPVTADGTRASSDGIQLVYLLRRGARCGKRRYAKSGPTCTSCADLHPHRYPHHHPHHPHHPQHQNPHARQLHPQPMAHRHHHLCRRIFSTPD